MEQKNQGTQGEQIEKQDNTSKGKYLKWEEHKKSTRLECVQVNRCRQGGSKDNRYQDGLTTRTSK